MNFNTWQKQQGLSNIELAQKLDVDPSYISYLKRGKRKPSPGMAQKIEQLSKGQVTKEELIWPDAA